MKTIAKRVFETKKYEKKRGRPRRTCLEDLKEDINWRDGSWEELTELKLTLPYGDIHTHCGNELYL